MYLGRCDLLLWDVYGIHLHPQHYPLNFAIANLYEWNFLFSKFSFICSASHYRRLCTFYPSSSSGCSIHKFLLTKVWPQEVWESCGIVYISVMKFFISQCWEISKTLTGAILASEKYSCVTLRYTRASIKGINFIDIFLCAALAEFASSVFVVTWRQGW